MTEQLGAHLVRKGLITQAQWDEAQKSQLIYGGSLGTNLVELGMLDLVILGQALSDTYHFPLVTDGELEAVTPETLALLKPELARNHQAFPLALEGRRLRVAMVEPQDPRHVDALGFATGMRIVPSILPELRMMQVLEKRYGIPKPLRPQRTGQPKPAGAPGVQAAPRPPSAAPPAPPLGFKPALPGMPPPASGVGKPPGTLVGAAPTAPGVAGPLSVKPAAGLPMAAIPPRPPGAPGGPGVPVPGAPPPRPVTAPPGGPGSPGVARPLGSAPAPGLAPAPGANLPPGMMQRGAPGSAPPGFVTSPPVPGGPPPAGMGAAGAPRPPMGPPVAAPTALPARPSVPGMTPMTPGAQVSVGTLAVARPPGGVSSPGMASVASLPPRPAPGVGSPPGAVLPTPMQNAPVAPGAGLPPMPAQAQKPVPPSPMASQPMTGAPRAPTGPGAPVPPVSPRPPMPPVGASHAAAPVPWPELSRTAPGGVPAPSPSAAPSTVAAPSAFPSTPAAPSASAAPSTPAAPSASAAPGTPVAPNTSVAPSTPSVPCMSAGPSTSSVPGMSAGPSTAAASGTPLVSGTAAAPGTPVTSPVAAAPVSENAPRAPEPVSALEPATSAPEIALSTDEMALEEAPAKEPMAPVEASPSGQAEAGPVASPPGPEAPAVASPPSEPDAVPRTAEFGVPRSIADERPSEGSPEWTPWGPVELPSEPAGEMEVSTQFDPSELGSEATSSWAQRGIEVDFSSQDAVSAEGDAADMRGGVPLASVLDFVPAWDPSAEAAARDADAQAGRSATGEDAQRMRFAEAVEALRQATSRGELGRALLSYVQGRFPRGFLLGENFGSACVGRAYGPGSDRPEVSALRVDLDAPSLLAMAAYQGGPVVSSVPESQVDEALFAALGESFSHLMAVPLRLRERAVGFVVVDGGPSPFGPEELEEMGQLLAEASVACARLHD